MISVLRNKEGRLRNGWWIALFYLALAALVVPASIHAAAIGSNVGIALQAVMAAVATGICIAIRRDNVASVVGDAGSWIRGVPLGIALGALVWGATAAWIGLSGAAEWHWGDNAFPN